MGYDEKFQGISSEVVWNNIEENANCGINADFYTGNIDGRYNWWGSRLGPSIIIFTLRGDRIIPARYRIKYFPWLMSPHDINEDE